MRRDWEKRYPKSPPCCRTCGLSTNKHSPASAAMSSAPMLKRLPCNRNTVLLCGMESHICVMQTALGALRDGYLVHVASDAVGSRTEWNWKIGLERMRDAGAVISSTEMMVYELMRSSGTPEFKELLPYIKQ